MAAQSGVRTRLPSHPAAFLYGRGGLLLMLTVSPNQMASLKLLLAVLLAQAVLTSSLPPFPPFPILFFMRFVEKNTEGLPLEGTPGLLSICQLLEIINLGGEWSRCCRCCRVLVVLRWEVLTSGRAWSRRTG